MFIKLSVVIPLVKDLQRDKYQWVFWTEILYSFQRGDYSI